MPDAVISKLTHFELTFQLPLSLLKLRIQHKKQEDLLDEQEILIPESKSEYERERKSDDKRESADPKKQVTLRMGGQGHPIPISTSSTIQSEPLSGASP